MKRILFLFAAIFSLALTAQAQVIGWSVKPGVYNKIEPYWNDMYLVKKTGKTGIIKGDGSVVVPAVASRITGFYDGLAIALQTDGGNERILGILSDDGSYAQVDGTFYAIPYQEFFSEGLLTITTPRGQTGYMNGMGHVVKTFNASIVSPFSEGYAVVGEGKDYKLIDKNFSEIPIRLGTVSGVYGGTAVYKGEAVIWDGNGKFYSFNVDRGVGMKISRPSSMDSDYLWGLSCITNRPADVVYTPARRSAETLTTTIQNGLYGYNSGDNAVLPCQFEKAEYFHGRYAIVTLNGCDGLLTYHDGSDTFLAKADEKISYRKSKRSDIVHKFGLSVPTQLEHADLTVLLKDENGIPVSVSNDGGGYEFKADGGNGNRTYLVEVEADGLKLWKGEIAYHYTVEADPVEVGNDNSRTVGNYKQLTINIQATNTQADRNYHCYVKAVISNPNSEAITTTVSMTGSNLLEAVSQRITIPAYGSKDISTYFTVRKAVSGQKVTVTTSDGAQATLDGLQLIPN